MRKSRLLTALLLSSFMTLGNAAAPTEGEIIDLGLSVKWRGYNIGATSASETGDIYAFACTTPGNYNRMSYPFFSWDTYSYALPTENIAATKYDAAFTTTDGLWRMPSTEEWEELFANCSSEQTTIGSTEGILFTSKKNGNSIFLPKILDTSFYSMEFRYYTSVAASATAANATSMLYGGTLVIRSNSDPYYGFPIRPVYNYAGPKLESITLTADKTTIFAGTTLQLSYTLTPADTQLTNGVWSSSDESVATVNKGVVKGIKAGTSTIRVECDGVEASIAITVQEVETVATDGYVDLGLSVKWAEKNLGANSIGETGNLYPWGYTTPDALDGFLEYKYFNQYSYQYALPLNDICGNQTYDAVAAATDGSAQLPNKAQAQELLDNCDYEAASVNGVGGIYYTSRINGQRIFMPNATSYWLGTTNDAKNSGNVIRPNTNAPDVGLNSQPYKQFPLRGVKYYTDVTLESLEIVGGDRSVYTDNNFYLTLKANPSSYEITDVEWTSSDSNVAAVINEKGLVWVKKAGVCVLTATCDGVSASITLTVKDVDVPNTEAGVHMGNNLCFTTHDLGVTEPYQKGTLYYFGSATPNTMPSSYPDTILGTDLDPAKATLGGDWHIPTTSEWQWLIDNTDMEWVEWHGRVGALLTSKVTGQQLYFTWNTMSQVYYFAAETMSNHTSINTYHAMASGQTMGGTSANTALPVRAVRTIDLTQVGVDEISYEVESADVYTISGILILKNATPADISTLPSGLYLKRSGNKVSKIIK